MFFCDIFCFLSIFKVVKNRFVVIFLFIYFIIFYEKKVDGDDDDVEDDEYMFVCMYIKVCMDEECFCISFIGDSGK